MKKTPLAIIITHPYNIKDSLLNAIKEDAKSLLKRQPGLKRYELDFQKYSLTGFLQEHAKKNDLTFELEDCLGDYEILFEIRRLLNDAKLSLIGGFTIQYHTDIDAGRAALGILKSMQKKELAGNRGVYAGISIVNSWDANYKAIECLDETESFVCVIFNSKVYEFMDVSSYKDFLKSPNPYWAQDYIEYGTAEFEEYRRENFYAVNHCIPNNALPHLEYEAASDEYYCQNRTKITKSLFRGVDIDAYADKAKEHYDGPLSNNNRRKNRLPSYNANGNRFTESKIEYRNQKSIIKIEKEWAKGSLTLKPEMVILKGKKMQVMYNELQTMKVKVNPYADMNFDAKTVLALIKDNPRFYLVIKNPDGDTNYEIDDGECPVCGQHHMVSRNHPTMCRRCWTCINADLMNLDYDWWEPQPDGTFKFRGECLNKDHPHDDRSSSVWFGDEVSISEIEEESAATLESTTDTDIGDSLRK